MGDTWGMTVRRARPDDADEIAGVLLRSRVASVPAIPAPVHSDAEVRDWIEEVVLATREVWVADDDAVVGLLVLDGDWVDQLYVDPAHTNGGIGSALVAVAN